MNEYNYVHIALIMDYYYLLTVIILNFNLSNIVPRQFTIAWILQNDCKIFYSFKDIVLCNVYGDRSHGRLGKKGDGGGRNSSIITGSCIIVVT